MSDARVGDVPDDEAELVTVTEIVDDDGEVLGEVIDDVVVRDVTDADGEVIGEIVEEHVVVVDAEGDVLADVVEVAVLDAAGEVLAEATEVLEVEGAPAEAEEAGAELGEGEAEDDDEDEDEEGERPESPFDRPGRWYVVHTYSGYENKVKGNLENIIKARELGGPDPRDRGPDGGCRRVQERQEGDGLEEGLPGLPARALHARRTTCGSRSARRPA